MSGSEDDGCQQPLYMMRKRGDTSSWHLTQNDYHSESKKKMEVSSVVELPNRVPYGLHATFVTEAELEAQKLIT
ncbi:hypothetical protein Leryth_023143 [Lithospermum erythrorhizon]|nr:hypothetical protein Leryth_023143 [Lithospermum erythrorhizon]